MKVLITGANGFIGSHICDELIKNKYKVIGLVRKTSNIRYLKNKSVELRYGEITKKETLKGLFKDIDVVVHSAATVEIDDSKKAFLINAEATKNVVDLSVEENVKKFIYISSQAAIGPSLFNNFKTEKDTPFPVSVYGKSKLRGEKEVLKRKDNIISIIIRPSAIFGPRDRETFVLFNSLKHGFIPLTGYKEKYFPFIYVKDFVKIVNFFIQWNGKTGEIFNIGDKKIYPYSSVFRLIGRIMNIKLHRYPFPITETFFFYIIPFIKRYLPSIINRDKMREFRHSYWFISSKKFDKICKIEYTNIKQAIEETIRWYKDEKWL